MAKGDIVLEGHKLIFADVARKVGVWILVRGTNKASLDFLSKADYRVRYTPKPIDCKAKTARDGRCAGLVVNPHNVTDAFSGDNTQRKADWDAKDNPMAFSERRGSYSEESSGPLAGCIKLDGKYIHGDYDLKGILLPRHESATLGLVTSLHGVLHVRGPRFYEVQKLVNTAIGADMVQHDADELYGEHSDEAVFVFGPKGEREELHSLAQIQSWYDYFGRKTVQEEHQPTKQPPPFRR